MKVQILVVDDEEQIRDMLARHFRYLGYEVDTAENGKDALAKLDEDRTDIVISDIMMPEMNGVDLLYHLRRDHPMVRAIMITGYVTLENAMGCMRNGAETCVFKPIEDLSNLETAVDQVVSRINNWHGILRDLQGMKP